MTTKLVDPKKTKSQSTGPIHETTFAFLSGIEQILDGVALIASKRGVSVDEQPASTKDNKTEKRDELSSAEIARLDDEEAKVMFQMLDDDRQRNVNNSIDTPVSVSDDTRKDDDKRSKAFGFNRYMIEDIWKIGSDRILKANYKRVRNDAPERKERKQRLNRAVVKKVNEKKTQSMCQFKT